jgi:hypothetical protein
MTKKDCALPFSTDKAGEFIIKVMYWYLSSFAIITVLVAVLAEIPKQK